MHIPISLFSFLKIGSEMIENQYIRCGWIGCKKVRCDIRCSKNLDFGVFGLYLCFTKSGFTSA